MDMTKTSTVNYEVQGKAAVERGGGQMQYTLKMIYRGDGTPWWVCSSGFEWVCTKEFFDRASVNDVITITAHIN